MMRAALLPLLVLLLGSAKPFALIAPATFVQREPTMTIYEVAEIITGCPSPILRGLARTESNERPDAIGDDGESLGIFQFRQKYQAYREGLYGKFDPLCPHDSAIVAGLDYMRALAELGDEDMAISAHCQGIDGVRLNGVQSWYVARVRRLAR